MTADLERAADRLIARWRDTLLFEYVFAPSLPRMLAPRPYFHPVRTLAGRTVTQHRPADHAWHLGLAYSWPVVGRWNLWGGPTYVRGRGYVQQRNCGAIRHLEWSGLDERLEWVDARGERLALERRTIDAFIVDAEAGAWRLDLACELQNAGPRPLRLGSPTTEGRPDAGYAGLSWRGSSDLRDAELSVDGRPARGDAMGARGRSVALAGTAATVALLEHPGNPGAPNRWFIRTDPYVLVTSSPVFDQALLLQPHDSIRLRHALLVADGTWNRESLERMTGGWLEQPA